jgi:hypothetical protein
VIASLDRFAMIPAAECAAVVCAIVAFPNQTITYSTPATRHRYTCTTTRRSGSIRRSPPHFEVNEPARLEARLDLDPDDLLILLRR